VSIVGHNALKNLWTEFAAQHSYALATNGKELQNPLIFLVAATLEKTKT
jgi:hypothetical protein